MGQDPNQPYSGQYGQPQSGNVPPYQGGYQQSGGGYQQQPGSGYPPPNSGYPPPNTGYQQQQQGGYNQYQQNPYGQAAGPMYNTGHPNGPTSINMDPNTAAGLSYLGTWLTGLIFYLMEKQNRFVRFHAMQSILAFAALFVLEIASNVIFSALSFVSIIGCFLSPLIGIAIVAVWIICMINAFQGKYFKLPVIGDYAERFANSGSGTPLG